MTFTVQNMTKKEALIAELARDIQHAPERVPTPPSDPILAKFNKLGTQLWLDTGLLEEAAKLWRLEMSALTTNNTLTNQVVQTGIMDDMIKNAGRQIREVEPGISAEDLVMDVAFVVNCHIALRLVRAFDALVSVELHPAIGYDIDKTLRYAERYYAINPERFIVKIPMTPEGFCAVARSRDAGIPINYTLGFSARQNYLATLMSKPNYCNVFLGRLNAVVADNHLGDGKFVGERVTLASQACVKQLRQADSSIPTHQIAASMRNAEQMVSLAGVDVFTIPPKAVDEFYHHGFIADDITLRTGENYEVHLAPEAEDAGVEKLWEVDDNFKKFAASLASRGGAKLTGDDLREADRDFGTKLFHDLTAEERTEIRKHGKIPETARWAGRISLDDLMTESALQSFIVDQGALDDRIRGLVASA
ncbi:MAG TPA: transaldolase family protein [Chthonomonadaceae bacterium]|nr:transaldolase family protein [Chthonomonadaceae bacterium]